MKSLAALKDLTSKLKQQVKSSSQGQTETDNQAWVKKGDLEREREQRYLEE